MNYLEIEKMRSLKNLEINEISLVSDPATKIPFKIVKSHKPKPKFETIQKMFLGYCDSEISMLDDEAVKDIKVEKSTEKNPFPSLAKSFNNSRHSTAFREVLDAFEGCIDDRRSNPDA